MNPSSQHASNAQDLRRYPRKDFSQAAMLLVRGEGFKEIQTLDISQGGIGAISSRALQTGQNCVLAFEVLLQDKARKINAWGTVTYCAMCDLGYRVGIQFDDADCMSQAYIQQLCQEC